MFRKIYGQIFRRNAFDDFFKYLVLTLSSELYPCYDWQAQRRLTEIKLVWREEKGIGFTPEYAAWKAVEEFALWILENKKEDECIRKLLAMLAGSIHFRYYDLHEHAGHKYCENNINRRLKPYLDLHLDKIKGST